MSATGSPLLYGLQRVLELLDDLLLLPISAMTSRCVNGDSVGAVGPEVSTDGRDKTRLVPGYSDDCVRPKSFLHDEMDEFNQILSELLNSARRGHCGDESGGWSRDADVTCHDDRRQTSCLTPDWPRSDAMSSYLFDSMDARVLSAIGPHDDDDDDDGECELLQIIEDDNDVISTCVSRQTASTVGNDVTDEDDADSGYQSGCSTMVNQDTAAGHDVAMTTPAALSAALQLQRRIDRYNGQNSGLTVTLAPDATTFEGFIRVHINLHKPINVMSVSSDVTSSDDVIKSGSPPETESFYLPANSSKVIHVTSEMTTSSVIQALLDKFMITDSCQKFALYESTAMSAAGRTLTGVLRRLTDDERPLQVCLRWYDDDDVSAPSRRHFVLQDNVTSEINWDAFSLPELEAFLRILRREEDSYIYQVQLKYDARKKAAEMRLRQLQNDVDMTSPSIPPRPLNDTS